VGAVRAFNCPVTDQPCKEPDCTLKKCSAEAKVVRRPLEGEAARRALIENDFGPVDWTSVNKITG
jgi:hypothetical protein